MPDTSSSLPNFLVIGAPKCATTSLFRYLETHPQVYMAPGKELRFFDKSFDRGIDWYTAHFAGAAGERALGEVTPLYLIDQAAAPRIASMLPDAKLIAILRHPVDRAYSQYWHSRLRDREARPFGEVIDAQLESEAAGEHPTASSIVSIGRYDRHLDRFSAYEERGRMQLFSFEDLRDDPGAVFSHVCEFLEVDQGHVPHNLGQAFNRPHRLRSRKARKALLRSRLPARAPRVARWVDRLLRDETEYPPMDAGVRRVLLDTYRADNVALAARWGRDLNDWNV